MGRWAVLLVFALATGAGAQEITGTYDIAGEGGRTGWGRITQDGADLVLSSSLGGQGRATGGASGAWTFRGAATQGLSGLGATTAAGARTFQVVRLPVTGPVSLAVHVHEGGVRLSAERWTRREPAASLRLVALPPDRARFSPYRRTGPNTVTVRCAVDPPGAPLDLRVRVVDRLGTQVLDRRLPQVQDAGQGVPFTWDGRLADGRCVDARRGPFSLRFAAAQDGDSVVESEAVSLVAVPRLEACFVVSGADGAEPTHASKVVDHDADVRLVAVVLAVVAGARPEEPGRTERACYVAVDDVRAAVVPKAGRVNVLRWDDATWGPLALRWQEVRALGLHSEAYRATQDAARRTSHGEFTNVVSNGPDEGRWLGRDTLEYAHLDAGTGGALEADTRPGTVRYRVDADHADPALRLGDAAPGSPGRRDARPTTSTTVFSGLRDGFSAQLAGAGPEVHRISRRGPSTHPLLAELETYRGVPWLYGSVADQVLGYIGYDCADLVFAAARRAGLTTRTQFTNANNLCRTYTRPVGTIPTIRFDLAGRLLDAKTGARLDLAVGGAATNIRPGDVVFFDWNSDGDWDHTTVLWEAPTGALDSTARFVWAHHEATSTDGFYIGPLSELVHPFARPTTSMAVRRF